MRDPFSFRRQNRCAICICILMLLSIPILLCFQIDWAAYVVLAAGGIAFFVLFHAYQRKARTF